MITNLSKIFNNVFKTIRGLPIITIVQITFFQTNKYFVDRIAAIDNCISHGVLWLSQVLAKLIVDASKSR